MSIIIVTTVVTVLLVVHYFRPTLHSHWIPRIVVNGSGGNQIEVYRTIRSRLVSEKQYKNCHERWLKLNPHVRMYWFNDVDCRRFMRNQGERVFNAYTALRPGAYKADLFRLCILYQRGGVYVDAETLPYVSLREMTRGIESKFISVLDSVSDGIHNGLIMSPKGHPFLKAGIERILRIVEAKSYEDGTLSITGPLCLARAINEYMGRESNTKFVAGLNQYLGQDLYLFTHQFGPSQYIYDGKQCLLAKKHCLWSYFTSHLKRSNYPSMYKKRQVYRI